MFFWDFPRKLIEYYVLLMTFNISKMMYVLFSFSRKSYKNEVIFLYKFVWFDIKIAFLNHNKILCYFYLFLSLFRCKRSSRVRKVLKIFFWFFFFLTDGYILFNIRSCFIFCSSTCRFLIFLLYFLHVSNVIIHKNISFALILIERVIFKV